MSKPCSPQPAAIFRGLRRPISGASAGWLWAGYCPDKVLLGWQKTTWNIPPERLRSGHNIGPGVLSPEIAQRIDPSGCDRQRLEFSQREPARGKGSKRQVNIARDGF